MTGSGILECGDCGDELTVNPDRGAARPVTFESSPGSAVMQEAAVYDSPAYLHADDSTPQCTSRADAAARRARKARAEA